MAAKCCKCKRRPEGKACIENGEPKYFFRCPECGYTGESSRYLFIATILWQTNQAERIRKEKLG